MYRPKASTMAEFGYKGSSIFRTAYYNRYYKCLPSKNTVLSICFIDDPNTFCLFRLSEKEYRDFENGRLSLVPPGCCNASGGESIENNTIVYKKNIKNLDQLKKALMVVEKLF